jgi:hypothetical protein
LGTRYSPDNKVEFHISKGVAGAAVARRRAVFVNLEQRNNRHSWGFSDKELAGFPHFTAIWSLPVFELDKAGNPTGKILGTINLDSVTRGAFSVLEGNPAYERLLEEFQDLVSKVASC